MDKFANRGSILVIDDDLSILNLLKGFLLGRGYRVDTAPSGEEGLNRIHQESYDVVLCDVMMPGLDGMAVLKFVAGRSPRPVVIMMTGSASFGTVVETIRQGAFDYLLKPFELEEVVLAVDRALAPHELALLSAVADCNRAILSAKDLYPMLEDMVARTRNILRADHVSIMLLDQDDHLRIVASTGLPMDVVQSTRLALGDRVAGRAASSRETMLLINGLDTYEDFRNLSVHRKIRSSIVHPIVYDHGVLGVLNISRQQTPHLFNVIDQKGVEVLGGLLGVAIAHLRLVDHLKAQRETELGKTYVELKEAHAQLQAAQEYSVQQEKFSAIGRFAGSMAHHLRNPLSIIMSNAQSLLKDPVAKEERLSLIIHQAKQANHMIGEMLRTATPKEAVGLRQTFGFEEWSWAVLKSLQQKLTDRSVSVVVTGMDPAWRVFGDRQALDQVLTNLITNAMEAMPHGGLIQVKGSIPQGGNLLALEVEDQGIGMTPEQLAKAFRPFVTTKPTGIGLGLYSAKQVVEAHGGQLTLTSVDKQGTVIRLTLPRVGISVDTVKEMRSSILADSSVFS